MIDIKTYGIQQKRSGGGTTKIIVNNGGISVAPEAHYLWGQYYNGTQDIEGDLTKVGSISASNYIYTSSSVMSDSVETNTVNTNLLNTNGINFSKFGIGHWNISEDESVNLNILISQDKELHIKPNDVDTVVISEDKTKINNTLDLTKETVGSKILLGVDVDTADNNNKVKSIYEEGVYFVDNNNNVAIGIANNYVEVGTDIGSPNFFSGSSGWRIQPDGTAEFQNLKVDGNLDVYVLTYNELRSTNGILLVTDCSSVTGAIDKTINGVLYWIITVNDFPPFEIDDYVLLQYRVDETRIFSFKGIVKAVNQDGKNTVRVLALNGYGTGQSSTDARGVTTFRDVDPDTANGEYLIRIGNANDPERQKIIKLNPYDGGYIDFMTDLNSSSSLADNDNITDTIPTACRIGNLEGVSYKGTTLQGYGIYSDNAYLTGAIKNLQNKWSLNNDGSGQLANGHISWTAAGELTIQIGNTDIATFINATTENVKVEIVDDFFKSGIIITQYGEIQLNANNIHLNGDVKIESADKDTKIAFDDGIIIYDENYIPSIRILNDELGNFDDYSFGENAYIYGNAAYELQGPLKDYPPEYGKNANNEVKVWRIDIGNYISGDTLYLKNMSVGGSWCFYSNGAYLPHPLNLSAPISFSSCRYEINIWRHFPNYDDYCVGTYTGNGVRNSQGMMCIPDITINSISENGSYYMYIYLYCEVPQDAECRYIYEDDLCFQFNFEGYAYQKTGSISKIASDGAVFATEAQKYNWFGPDGTNIRYNNNLFKINNDGILRNIGSYMSDISSTLPTKYINDTVEYSPTLYDGLIVFDYTGGSRAKVTLPNPSICMGKVYYIKNLTGNATNIECDYLNVIMDKDSCNKVNNIQVTNTFITMVSCGSAWARLT